MDGHIAWGRAIGNTLSRKRKTMDRVNRSAASGVVVDGG